jgi:hypothetical protein
MVLLAALALPSSSLNLPLRRATLATGLQSEDGAIVTGAPRSGKSSIGFQAAINAALQGCRVVYFCKESALGSKLPRPLVALEDLSTEALQRIEFNYIETLAHVRQYCATLLLEHSQSSSDGSPPSAGTALTSRADLPALLIVDDDDVVDAQERLGVARTLAVLTDTIAWARQISARPGAAQDEHGAHSAYYLYVTNTPPAPLWHGGPNSAFPFNRVPVHIVTHTAPGLADGSYGSVAHVFLTRPDSEHCDGPIAALRFDMPVHAQTNTLV